VTVTSRHLVSMMGGVRHYDKLCRKATDIKVQYDCHCQTVNLRHYFNALKQLIILFFRFC